MALFKNRSFSKLFIHLRQSAKYSVTTSVPSNMFTFKSHFSSEEEAKILNIINGSSSDQLLSMLIGCLSAWWAYQVDLHILSEIPKLAIKRRLSFNDVINSTRLNVPQNRSMNIIRWKNKRGPFRSLSEVLEVDGLGEKILEEICLKIISENVNYVNITKLNNGVNKKTKQLITPTLTGNIVNKLKSSVGLHLSPMGISWAKLSREQNKLNSWHFEDFSSLPKKMLLTDTFNLAIKVIPRIPASDVYIFEASPALRHQGQSQLAAIPSYKHLVELASMLIALLNTSINHNMSLQEKDSEGLPQNIENRVFYLRSKVSARLFRTLVGKEKVTAIHTITKLLDGNDDFSFPCTPISIDSQLKHIFMSQSPPNKELLCQSLMLVVSFMDLCVYKNNASLSEISNKINS